MTHQPVLRLRNLRQAGPPNWKPYWTATQSVVAGIALSNALAVIASRSCRLSEIVIENVNGLLFPVGDSEALANQIISYFSNNPGPVFANNLLSHVGKAQDGLEKMIEDISGL